jgi:methylenetetrahydrofolate dehydrogenase (NADP+) / methenyltetrahydrofolate cyclohydrolase
MQIVDGRQIANSMLSRLKREVARLKTKPSLAVVLVGDNKASLTYVRKKQEAAEDIGVKFALHKFPASITTVDLVRRIRQIQKQSLSGIIVQLPLPKHIDKKAALNQLNPEMDVDFLSWVSLGKLVIGDTRHVPPAPGAVLEILKQHNIGLKGKHVVLVGQGDLIGKPLTNILVKLPITLTTCNKDTKNLSFFTKQADILITGVGKYNLIRGNMVKPGVVAIDAGTAFHEGKMYGDINFEEVSKKAALITPTPGGVGPITVAKLLENTVQIAKLKQNA